MWRSLHSFGFRKIHWKYCKIVFLQLQIHEKDSWEIKEKRKNSSVMIDWVENRKGRILLPRISPSTTAQFPNQGLSIANNSLWQWAKNPQIRNTHTADGMMAYGRSMVIESGYKSRIGRPIFQITNLRKNSIIIN